jgi:hypothetical protein
VAQCSVLRLRHKYRIVARAHSSQVHSFSGYSLTRGSLGFQAHVRIKPMLSISVRVLEFRPIGKTIKRKDFRPGPDELKGLARA